ncbi:MAG TPA: hypothetical protein VFT70_04765 [Nocardioides sp.]|nr:hypothetical protein [Nocardioides sp.]
MTPVTRTATVLGSLVLAAGVLTAVPAQADPLPDPVSGLVGPLLGPQPDGGRQRHRDRSDLGHAHAKDGVLRRGCHNYRYRYAVGVRTNDWTLETFLDDRTGDTIASGAFSADSDPRRGRAVFRFCRYSTYAGTFTIRAKLSWYNDAGEHQGWFEPSHFRLRRP